MFAFYLFFNHRYVTRCAVMRYTALLISKMELSFSKALFFEGFLFKLFSPELLDSVSCFLLLCALWTLESCTARFVHDAWRATARHPKRSAFVGHDLGKNAVPLSPSHAATKTAGARKLPAAPARSSEWIMNVPNDFMKAFHEWTFTKTQWKQVIFNADLTSRMF